MSFIKSRYNSKLAVMATQHDKAKLVAQHFEQILSMQVQEVLVDTDVLGTFSAIDFISVSSWSSVIIWSSGLNCKFPYNLHLLQKKVSYTGLI